MHIPDGFLSTPVWTTTASISLSYLIIAIRQLKKRLHERLIPIMGILGAFIFAAQMLNFPVAGGTSGHLLGGVLAAIVIGPLAGSFVLTTVFIVQCLIFQDGGLTALGANILNISIIGTFAGYGIYALLNKLMKNFKNRSFVLAVSSGIAAWSSVVLASTACSLELALSGIVPIKIVLPAMVGIHMIIGIGEAIVTVLAVSALKKVRPDLIKIS